MTTQPIRDELAKLQGKERSSLVHASWTPESGWSDRDNEVWIDTTTDPPTAMYHHPIPDTLDEAIRIIERAGYVPSIDIEACYATPRVCVDATGPCDALQCAWTELDEDGLAAAWKRVLFVVALACVKAERERSGA